MDAAIPAGASPDDSGAIDLGTIRMEKYEASEFRKAVGMISVPDSADPPAFRSCSTCLAGERIRLITELNQSESMLHQLKPRLTNRVACLRLD